MLEEIGISNLYTLVAFIGATVAIAIALKNSTKDREVEVKSEVEREIQMEATEARHNAEVLTKLDFMSEDIKDIKAENRHIREDLVSVRDLAKHADERAEAAHRRLDRAGIDSAFHLLDEKEERKD